MSIVLWYYGNVRFEDLQLLQAQARPAMATPHAIIQPNWRYNIRLVERRGVTVHRVGVAGLSLRIAPQPEHIVTQFCPK